MGSIPGQLNIAMNVGAVCRKPHPRAEERLNAATHAFGAFLSVVGLVFLVIQADSLGAPTA
jgi:predicted membrane channel-forming protein YqfA (hemolysin III family)